MKYEETIFYIIFAYNLKDLSKYQYNTYTYQRKIKFRSNSKFYTNTKICTCVLCICYYKIYTYTFNQLRHYFFFLVHCFNKFDSRTKLNPPIMFFAFQTIAIKTVYILNGGQQ